MSRISLAICISLWLAGAARADLFEPPFDLNCGNANVASFLFDEAGFSLSAKCESHCKQTVAQCKKFAKRVAACQAAERAVNLSFEIQNCAESLDGAEEKSCKADLKASDQGSRPLVKTQIDGFLANCDSWGAGCLTDCGAP